MQQSSSKNPFCCLCTSVNSIDLLRLCINFGYKFSCCGLSIADRAVSSNAFVHSHRDLHSGTHALVNCNDGVYNN